MKSISTEINKKQSFHQQDVPFFQQSPSSIPPAATPLTQRSLTRTSQLSTQPFTLFNSIQQDSHQTPYPENRLISSDLVTTPWRTPHDSISNTLQVPTQTNDGYWSQPDTPFSRTLNYTPNPMGHNLPQSSTTMFSTKTRADDSRPFTNFQMRDHVENNIQNASTTHMPPPSKPYTKMVSHQQQTGPTSYTLHHKPHQS
jgi:hypothetical protein